ncbi:hypothetical protein, partial [Caulobacter sp. 17J65-9]|uniref:tetratricopeptide repeat protein n=1 Tax=Caulobacter sp. 17J65-9 TaxID=2709382 RepID=UPI0013C90AA6
APAIDLWTLAATAEALARSGDVAGAEALIGPTAGDCYPCLVARGRIAALKGDARGADRWFGQAAKQGPSLPPAYAAWGEAKAARGDLEGAIALYREAQARGPKWADPLKLEGDALARGGDWKAAAKRYDKAARLAPRWDELRRERAAALSFSP